MEGLVEATEGKGMEGHGFTESGLGCRFWVVRRWKKVGLVEGSEGLEQIMWRVRVVAEWR